MIDIRHYDFPNEDFKRLDNLLNDYYFDNYGEVSLKYHEINSLKHMDEFFIAYDNDEAIGIICVKKFDEKTGELKRLFVMPEYRRAGIAMQMISCGEEKAKEIGYDEMVLETGVEMSQAIDLYKKAGYIMVDNFGDYIGDDITCCMKKSL